MPRQSVFDMKVSKVYPLLVAKAEKKGRTKAEVDEVTAWLTGYDMPTIDNLVVLAMIFQVKMDDIIVVDAETGLLAILMESA
jgi:hypothetical protein